MGVGLLSGGPVALIYGLLFVGSGTLACAASIAEMASICPISGAQYHWTYMFSPKRMKLWVTFIQGTLCFRYLNPNAKIRWRREEKY